MLLDQAVQLKARLATHLDLKAAGKQEQVFRTRAGQLAPIADALSQKHRDWLALRAAGLVSKPVAAKPQLRSVAKDLLERFKVDRAVLAEADDKIRFQLVAGVKSAADEFEADAREAWEAHMTARADFPNETILTALDAISTYRAAVKRIREASAEFERLRAQTPSAADLSSVLARVEAVRASKDEALAAMQGTDLPADVLAFLRKTGQGGAALSDLTPGVRAWLESRNLLDAFRIVASSRI